MCAHMLDDGGCKVAPYVHNGNAVNDPRRITGDTVITASVGQGGRNVPDDVFKIQYSLDKIAPIDGGPMPQLVCDGKCGPKTIAAIKEFQKKHFGWAGCDGRIDPGKQTLKKINEKQNHHTYPYLPLSLSADGWLLADMVKHVPYTKRYVAAARQNISVAMGGADSFAGGTAMDLANRHFAVDAGPSPKRPVLQKIFDVYGQMLTVLDRPTEFFTLDTDDRGEGISSVAFARLGGLFDKQDLSGKIVFRRGAYFATLGQDFAAFVFIHELRHFVEREGQTGHFGKGWVTDPGMVKLTPAERAMNCDTFAGFALEAENGEMARPGWLKSTEFR